MSSRSGFHASAAMTEITDWVYGLRNSTGPKWMRFRRRDLSHPSSRSAVIHCLKNLKHWGYAYEPEELKSWASAHGWRTEDAVELQALAGQILDGVRFHTITNAFGTKWDIERWQEQAGL